jgi:hypothetical protein
MNKPISAPCNARSLALSGFDLTVGFSEYEDKFTGDSTMRRRGIIDACNCSGDMVKIPFTAQFKFGKPFAPK